MELLESLETIDRLLIFASEEMRILEQRMSQEATTGEELNSSAPGTPYHTAAYTLHTEHAAWRKVHEGLITARSALQEVEESKRQRSLQHTQPSLSQ